MKSFSKGQNVSIRRILYQVRNRSEVSRVGPQYGVRCIAAIASLG